METQLTTTADESLDKDALLSKIRTLEAQNKALVARLQREMNKDGSEHDCGKKSCCKNKGHDSEEGHGHGHCYGKLRKGQFGGCGSCAH